MLRDLLLKDFGLDLPIAGGSGRNAQDPIVMDTDSLFDAIEAQDSLAACLFGGPEHQWRLVGKQADSARPWIECCHYEIRFIDGERLVAEPRQLWFDLRRLKLTPGRTTPACGVPLGERFGFGLPAQFGWLHFVQMSPSSTEAGGLKLDYASRQTQVALTLYPAAGDQASESGLQAEMDRAMAALRTEFPGLQPVSENKNVNLRYASFDAGRQFSALALTRYRGHYCHIRMTMAESAIGQDFQCLMDSLSAMLGFFNPKS
jgi:hypothetical protein